ncbi:unnamed protein product [Paramecium pentaurelia]|uniref:Proteasome assembly chaperone 3 n=1 Tax=Paramecium pentaurelia TaxID=43138 RepID=A0A8S1W8P3_9CILI|nr:unnamed protein product [Paramecium pentaurelia]
MNIIQFQLFENTVQVSMTLFRNAIQCVVSDTQKFGSVLIAECEKMGEDENIYEVKTKFGSREIVEYEYFARKIIEEMYNSKRIVAEMQKKYQTQEKQFNVFLGKKLLLFISLNDRENIQKNKAIIEEITTNLTNLI